MARRGSNRHRLFRTGRKLEDKEPGRSVPLSLLALSSHHCLLPFHRKIHPLPSVQTRQEPGLLLLSVGSHFSLTNDIRRHFIFCLCNPYLCFRTSPVTLSYKPLKEDKDSFFLPGDCSLWIIITTLLSCPCTAEIHIFIPFHLFL